MAGRYGLRFAQTQLEEVGGGHRVGVALGFVDHQNYFSLGLAQLCGNHVVVRGDALATIHKKQNQVRLNNCLSALFGHFGVNTVFGHRLKPASVHYQIFSGANTAYTIMAITS